MYTVVLKQGSVIRDSDQKIVAPCQSDQDTDFLAYIAWVNSGNEPLTIEDYPENLD